MKLNFLKVYSIGFLVSLFILGTVELSIRAAEPTVESSELTQLLSLPSGVSGQSSLIVRSRHVEKVRFSGAGSSSKYGFADEKGIIKEGLWLRFKNLGPESWSGCAVEFSKSLDASKYNSVILWVRSLEKGQKIFITLQDRGWKDKLKPQAISAIFPSRGLPKNKILQVVIPYKALSYNASFDFSRLTRMGFQYGRQNIGNGEGEVIEILGMAFVDQKTAVSQIFVVDPSNGADLPREVRPKNQGANPATLKPSVPPNKKVSPLLLEKKINTKKIDFDPDRPATIKYVPEKVVPTPVPTPMEKKTEPAEIKKVHRPIKAVESKKQLIPEPSPLIRIYNPLKNFPDWPYILFSGAILGLGALLLIQRKNRRALGGLGPVLYKLNWPLLTEGLANTTRMEKKFWSKLSQKKISTAWISPYQAFIEREPNDEHHGEGFLRHQIKAAERAGVRLLPSLCFVRSIFNFESFLANPQLYLTKVIPSSEIHLSDEELRVRYIGYFPVWIPPYWQKQKGLPQKLLLAYGKLPGMMATSDSVQFNLRSPELRRMAIRVAERFAQLGCLGVRIEGASALVNSSLNLYWGGAFNELGLAQDREFWDEVIQTVKSKYPNFIFIADGSGPGAQKLHEFGFDFFENNHLMEILHNQIRLEEVGTLESILTADYAHLLNSSIYDVAPLFRTLPPASIHRQQSLLSGMLVGFLPGMIEHDGQIPQELGKFYSLLSNWPAFRKGKFVLLPTSSPEILAFARWEKKIVYIVVANFSTMKKMASVRLNPFINRLENEKLYLFSDALHGATLMNDVKGEINQSPALAILGQDLKEAGLYLSMAELSLRLFSVNLGQPIQHETPSEVRQLHKT